MEKQEFKSKWDDLAREMGVQITPETEQREEARSTEPPATTYPPPRAESSTATVSPPPKRPPADWAKLAGDLGLPPGEPEATPIQDSFTPTREETAPRALTERPSRESRPPAEPSERPERPERPERSERRERHGRRGQRTESRGRQRQSSDRPRESREPRAPRRRDAETTSESRRPSMAESDAPEAASVERREEPAKPAAVSLWHKIFGAPAEQAGKTTDVPAAMHTTHIEKASEAVEESFGSEEVRSLSDADVLAEDYFDEFPRGEAPVLESDDADTTDRKRGRSRRRRRGGRGRKSGERRGETRRAETGDAAPKDSLESGDDFDDLGLSDADDEFADASATDEQYPPEEDSDGESQEASEMSRSKAAQRTIPSWDEAIGFIVDSNMQNRSQRRPSSRGPSRGRPRGRRKN